MQILKQRTLVALMVAVVPLLTSGCAIRPPGQLASHRPVMSMYATNGGEPKTSISPGFGFVYTNYKAPLIVRQTNKITSSKVGKARTKFVSLLWYPIIGGWDDASIKEAAANGGITKIDHAEYEMFQILGTYGEFEVTVYGE